MRYVLDASVAVKWVLPESDTAKALSLRNDLRAGTHDFVAPDTFPVEVAHALTRDERRNTLQQWESIVKLVDVLNTAPLFSPISPCFHVQWSFLHITASVFMTAFILHLPTRNSATS